VSAQCADVDEYLSDVKSTVKTTSRVRRVAGGSTVRKSSRKRVAETPLSSVKLTIIFNDIFLTNIFYIGYFSKPLNLAFFISSIHDYYSQLS